MKKVSHKKIHSAILWHYSYLPDRQAGLLYSLGKNFLAPKNRYNFLRGKKSFTLIELVLVTVILVVVGMAVYGTFTSGINIWRRVVKESVTEDVALFLKNISYDLRNSFRIAGIKFRGGKRRVSFPTRIRHHGADGAKDSIGRVSYSFDRRKGEVYKKQVNYSEIYRKKSGRKRVLAKGISSLEFQYFVYDPERKEYSWVTSWQERDEPFGVEIEDNLPLIVKMKIGIPDGSFEKKFVKTIPVPAACCWPLLDE